jgi:hypothetical protein
LSPTLRQSGELFRKLLAAYDAIGRPVPARSRTRTHVELDNGSRIISLPGREGNIRSYSKVALLVIDEAARVPDDLYRSVRPMLAVSRGRLVCLSTPFGKRGFFYRDWEGESVPWHRIRVPWQECPRITPEFIAAETQALGDSWVRQEYECRFESLEGLVYPDFESQCAVDVWPQPAGKKVGGIDFGFRNPFCALWGVLDRDDVLWIGHERYLRQTPIHEHASALPRDVLWYADPAGRTEINELSRAGLKVRRGPNAIQSGIAAVTARLRTGRLRICRAACPNIFAEAFLYRYAGGPHPGATGEAPLDCHNHALAALRYAVAGLDTGFMARFRSHPRAEPASALFQQEPLETPIG